MVIVSTVIIGLVCLLVGYALGYNQVTLDGTTHARTADELEQTQAELATLEDQLIDTRLNADVQRDANSTLRESLTAEYQKSARLAEEVAFYKGLMSPSSLAKGLQIAELEVVPDDDVGQYRYQLLLTQVALRRSYIAGEVRIDVIGADGEGIEAVLSLTELTELKAYPLKFRFRYFQDLAGRLTLPAGFVPARVLVTANQNGKEPLQVTFPWPAAVG